ncbi:MAG: HD-GYP domain-containing protein, partial [Kiritimatiellia bacterium]
MESHRVTILAVAKLAESCDPDTGRHLDRIREYTRVIARHLRRLGYFPNEITPGYIELLYETSPLHDLGKVGIPDSILLKPGRLTSEEYNIMKFHTVIGGETIGAALAQYPGMEYLRIARDIALTHHER